MKKVLSLILAVLMLAGCMSFSAFAGETFKISDKLTASGVSHAVLTQPIATAPAQDGVIGDGEYSVSRTASAEIVGDWFAGENYTEYFAYDADWLYYAVTSSREGNLGQTMAFNFKAEQEVSAFDGFLYAPNTMGGKNSFFTTNGVVCAFNNMTWADMKGHLFFNTSVCDLSRFDVDPVAIYAENLDYGPGDSAPYDVYYKVANAEVNNYAQGNDSFQTVFEVKISRKCFADSDVYAYYFAGSGWNYNQRVTIGTVLSEEAKSALGTDAVIAPGYIVIDEADIITHEKASVRISSTQNGLRFKTSVNNAFIAELEAVEGNVVEVGTLIAPTDTLGGAKLTHEFAGKKLDVKSTLDAPFAEGEVYNVYAGSITSLNDYNLEREFTAVGYVKVTNGENIEYYYSNVAASRSAAYVAAQALLDAESYTATEIELIKELIPAKVEA